MNSGGSSSIYRPCMATLALSKEGTKWLDLAPLVVNSSSVIKSSLSQLNREKPGYRK